MSGKAVTRARSEDDEWFEWSEVTKVKAKNLKPSGMMKKNKSMKKCKE